MIRSDRSLLVGFWQFYRMSTHTFHSLEREGKSWTFLHHFFLDLNTEGNKGLCVRNLKAVAIGEYRLDLT